jgi:hypothetical protein
MDVRTPRSTVWMHRTATVSLLLLATLAVGSLASTTLDRGVAATASAAASKKRPYCTTKRTRNCVRVPKAAQRPPKVKPQGAVPVDTENAGGVGGGPADEHRSEALAWAKTQLGMSKWAWHCEGFVEASFGTSAVFASAASAAKKLKPNRGSIRGAPPGALVFFAKTKANRNFGHVGLSLGKGRMISALKTVARTNYAKSQYWRGIYIGWADAPRDWPGRIPPPPADISSADENMRVRITAPAAGSTVSGDTLELLASASGAAGVAFDAYYATAPNEAATRGWHPLGTAIPDDGRWKLTWNTTSVPDQGDGAWGTVNIAAIAIDAQGRRTGVRDYRRFTVDNKTGSSPTLDPGPGTITPPAQSTFPETAGGYANTWTDYRSAGGTAGPGITSGQTVQVRCRREGFRVSSGNTWWYLLASSPWNDGFYATADAFYNNGQTSGTLIGTPFFDPQIPLCPP